MRFTPPPERRITACMFDPNSSVVHTKRQLSWWDRLFSVVMFGDILVSESDTTDPRMDPKLNKQT